jgi:hypothetical protein
MRKHRDHQLRETTLGTVALFSTARPFALLVTELHPAFVCARAGTVLERRVPLYAANPVTKGFPCMPASHTHEVSKPSPVTSH